LARRSGCGALDCYDNGDIGAGTDTLADPVTWQALLQKDLDDYGLRDTIVVVEDLL